MKQISFTMFRAFLTLVVLAMVGVSAASAQPVYEKMYDDGGKHNNYNDKAPADYKEFRPADPCKDIVYLEFSEWNVDAGDEFYVLDGPWSERDEAQKFFPKGDNGVNNAPGGGWVNASCDNPSGILTIYFKPNGDGIKGKGWCVQQSDKPRPMELECPADETITATAWLGCFLYAKYEIPAPVIICPSNDVKAVSSLGDIGDYIRIYANDERLVFDYEHGLAYLYNEYTLECDGEELEGISCKQKLTFALPALACNDDITIALNAGCQGKVTPDMVLENGCELLEGLLYDVIVKDANGKVIEDGVITKKHIGTTLTATVKSYLDYNSCSVDIAVEDNIKPWLHCPEDDFIYCGMDINDGININGMPISDKATAFDGCGVDITKGEWEFHPLDCSYENGHTEFKRGDYLGVWKRKFTAKDWNGNEAYPCYQSVYVIRPQARLDKKVHLECGTSSDVADLEPTAVPYYSVPNKANPDKPLLYPLPLDHAGCGYAIDVTDSRKIPTCGKGYKIFRTWKIYDWCNHKGPKEITQVVIVEDTTAPVIACSDETIELGTTPLNCDATFVLPTPATSDDCSEVTVKAAIYHHDYVVAYGFGPHTLPVGEYTVVYSAVDECLNYAEDCERKLVISDDDEPVCVVDEYTVLPLGDEDHGSVTICADNLDSGSYDNCETPVLLIKKMNDAPSVNFTKCVSLSCDDLRTDELDNAHDNECPGTILIRFRAYDDLADGAEEAKDVNRDIEAGGMARFSECMVEVEVQDKVRPEIQAPADKLIDCADKDPYSFFGTPIFSDNCDKNPTLTHRDNGSINECGVGSITRTWTVEDACGNKAFASQTITSEHRSDFVVTFPKDIDEECTGDDYAFDASDVKVEGDDCENILIRASDKRYEGVEGACYKIIRTIEVINWCVYDVYAAEPNDTEEDKIGTRKYQDQGDGYIKYVQIIRVKDTEDPYVTEGPAKLKFEDRTDGCYGPWHIEIAADDACTGAANLDISWRVLGTGQQGTGTDAAGVLDYGSYTIIYWIKDGCGNTIEVEYDFEIVDAKNPNLVCVGYLTSDLMPIDNNGDHTVDGGMSEVWASEFVQSYEDNCEDCEGDDCFLIEDVSDAYYGDGYSADAPGADASTGLQFTCDDYKAEYLRAIAVWAKDAAGNWTYCVAFFELQNNMGACGDAKASIAVAITTEQNEEVEGAKIELTGMDMVPAFTNRQGAASFLAPKGGDYTVVPQKNIDALNGVSTFDIILMTNHVLGTKEFTSPYQLIAADVNKSGSITASDMVQIRQLILNVTSEFPNNTSWRFVDKSFDFANASNPWATPFPEVVSINGLTDATAADFIGVKIGDVNGNAVGAQPRNAVGTLTFEAADATIAAGQEYTVDFTSADMANVAGYQFTMAFDQSNLEFVDVKAGALAGLTEGNFGLTKLDEGVITTSYNATDLVANDEVLFSITFRAKSDVQLSNAVSINSRYTAAEGYDANLSTLDVAIEFGNTVVAEGFELFQNAPNPFQTETRIGFNLSEAGAATMTIMDISGKVLKVIDGEYAKGYNEVTLNRSELSGAGVLYYQLNTANDSATKKMILVE